jgi:hypothetical protein
MRSAGRFVSSQSPVYRSFSSLLKTLRQVLDWARGVVSFGAALILHTAFFPHRSPARQINYYDFNIPEDMPSQAPTNCGADAELSIRRIARDWLPPFWAEIANLLNASLVRLAPGFSYAAGGFPFKDVCNQ